MNRAIILTTALKGSTVKSTQCLGSNSSSISYWLCDLGHIPKTLCLRIVIYKTSTIITIPTSQDCLTHNEDSINIITTLLQMKNLKIQGLGQTVPGDRASPWRSQDLHSSHNFFTPYTTLANSMVGCTDGVRVQKHYHSLTSLVSTIPKSWMGTPGFLPLVLLIIPTSFRGEMWGLQDLPGTKPDLGLYKVHMASLA